MMRKKLFQLWAFGPIVVSTASFVLTFGACSDDKSPPDDGGARRTTASAGKAGGRCTGREAAFRECAGGVLGGMVLSKLDRDVLMSCDLAEGETQAPPQSVSIDEFEAARSSIISLCL